MRYLVFFFLTTILNAQEVNVTLAWDANPEPDISGYKLYVGTSHGNYTSTIPVTGITKTLSLPKDVLHFAVVTAVNTSGLESLPSSELCFQVFRVGEGKAPSPPINLHKSSLSASIEQSSDLKLWVSIYSQPLISMNEPTFYRLVLKSP